MYTLARTYVARRSIGVGGNGARVRSFQKRARVLSSPVCAATAAAALATTPPARQRRRPTSIVENGFFLHSHFLSGISRWGARRVFIFFPALFFFFSPFLRIYLFFFFCHARRSPPRGH